MTAMTQSRSNRPNEDLLDNTSEHDCLPIRSLMFNKTTNDNISAMSLGPDLTDPDVCPLQPGRRPSCPRVAALERFKVQAKSDKALPKEPRRRASRGPSLHKIAEGMRESTNTQQSTAPPRCPTRQATADRRMFEDLEDDDDLSNLSEEDSQEHTSTTLDTSGRSQGSSSGRPRPGMCRENGGINLFRGGSPQKLEI